MTLQSKKFVYSKSYKIIHWGCAFDSLLELKFAISIQDEYEFLRSRVHIYYDRRTKKPTNYIRNGILRYTPDFLIRHKETREAFLVEIKPDAFCNTAKLSLRREVAENYICWKKYDWHYKVVFAKDILLTNAQYKEFEECCKLKSKSACKIKFHNINSKYDRSTPSFFKTVPDNSHVEFVMFGTRKHLV